MAQDNTLRVQDVVDQTLDDVLSERYLSYALSTIMSRSLPDVRDGLKPVHRRLLYAMYQLQLRPETSPKKCARVVGDVIGRVILWSVVIRRERDVVVVGRVVERLGVLLDLRFWPRSPPNGLTLRTI